MRLSATRWSGSTQGGTCAEADEVAAVCGAEDASDNRLEQPTFGIGDYSDLARENHDAEGEQGCGLDGSIQVHSVPSAEWADALDAVRSYAPRQEDGGYLEKDEKAFLEAQQTDVTDHPIARVRFECGMLITREVGADVGADESVPRWRPLHCWSKQSGHGDEDDYEAMLKRSWSFADWCRDDPLLLVRPLGDDEGALEDAWWMRTGVLYQHSEAWSGEKAEAGGNSIADRVKVNRRGPKQLRREDGDGDKLVLSLPKCVGLKMFGEVHWKR